MNTYEFITVWHVGAPIETVWNEIYHPEAWPTWWPGVERVVQIREGDANKEEK